MTAFWKKRSLVASLVVVIAARSNFNKEDALLAGYSTYYTSRFTTISENSSVVVDAVDEDDMGRRPSLILHVGPHKTGTTTLQEDMGKHFTNALARDKFVYLGKSSRTETLIQRMFMSGRCFRGVGKALLEQKQQQNNATTTTTMMNFTAPAGTPPCWFELQEELQKYHANNTSIILSDEDFSNDYTFRRSYHGLPGYFEALAHVLKDWNIIVVVGYRRYAEWAVSSVKQFQVHECFRFKRSSAGWPDAGGAKCPEPYDDTIIPTWMHRQPYPSANVYHSAQEHQLMWQQHGFETRMLNFHSAGQHLSTTLFCDVLHPSTPHTCDFARNGRPTKTVANKRSVAQAAYSTIAYAAAVHRNNNNKSIVNTTTTTRGRLTMELQHYHQQTLGLSFQDLPLKCPPRHWLEHLLNISLAVEEQVMPHLYYRTPGNIEQHMSSFWHMADVKKELCSVDTDALLQGVSTMDELKTRLNTMAKNMTNGAAVVLK